MTYQGVNLSKREAEWVKWFETGSDHWQEAFAQYKARRIAKRWSPQYEVRAKTWFNKTVKSLKRKGLFLNCPYAFISVSGICWKHPGFENSGFVAETVQLTEDHYDFHKPIL